MSKQAPTYEIEIDGKKLSPGTLRNVRRVNLQEALSKTARLDIEIEAGHSNDLKLDDIRIGRTVIAKLGYGSTTVKVFEGRIKIWKPVFNKRSTADRFVLSAFDISDDMKRLNEPAIHAETNPKAIAEKIIRRYNLTPFIAPEAELVTLKHKLGQSLTQKKTTDWELLCAIAKKVNYKIFCRDNTVYIANEAGLKQIPYAPRRFVYNPEIAEFRDATLIELISFTPEVDAARQRTRVVVKSWDAFTDSGERIGKKNLRDIPGGGEGFTEITVSSTVEQVLTVHSIARNLAQAQSLAESELKRRAEDLVMGDVTFEGDPSIRIGQFHDFAIRSFGSIGEAFGGSYLFKGVKHDISDAGFITTADVSKRTMEI